MKPLVDAEGARSLDAHLIETVGMPSHTLMETAGAAVAQRVLRDNPHSALVVCGPGNNGGDGFVCARHLVASGVPVVCILSGAPDKLSNDCSAQLSLAQRLGLMVKEKVDASEFRVLAQRHAVIVDALFGTGLTRSLTGDVHALVEAINAVETPVIAVDVPSGINASTGEVLGIAVQAEATVSFLVEKIGCAVTPGALYAGEVTKVHLGAPLESGANWFEVEASDIDIPALDVQTHKNARGHVLCVGGESRYAGACALAASAAQRAGAGLVTLRGGEPSSASVIRNAHEEAWPNRVDAIVFGPGTTTDCLDTARPLIEAFPQVPMVVDAGAIEVILTNFPQVVSHCVFTPHPGEVARVIDSTSQAVQANRVAAAANLAKRGGIWVLKGHRSIVVAGGAFYVIPTGGPRLATAGAGDVLAGAIGALLAQGKSGASAAICGAFVHGVAGERLPAGGIADELPPLIARAIADLTMAT